MSSSLLFDGIGRLFQSARAQLLRISNEARRKILRAISRRSSRRNGRRHRYVTSRRGLLPPGAEARENRTTLSDRVSRWINSPYQIRTVMDVALDDPDDEWVLRYLESMERRDRESWWGRLSAMVGSFFGCIFRQPPIPGQGAPPESRGMASVYRSRQHLSAFFVRGLQAPD